MKPRQVLLRILVLEACDEVQVCLETFDSNFLWNDTNRAFAALDVVTLNSMSPSRVMGFAGVPRVENIVAIVR